MDVHYQALTFPSTEPNILYILFAVVLIQSKYDYTLFLFSVSLFTMQQRPLQFGPHVTNTSSRLLFVPIGLFRPCDQNIMMAATVTIRSNVRLIFRLFRLIPDCTTCSLTRLKSCTSSGASFQRNAAFDSFGVTSRNLWTSVGEWCGAVC